MIKNDDIQMSTSYLFVICQIVSFSTNNLVRFMHLIQNKKIHMEKSNSILKILADWNPLDVPDTIANEEYASYIQVLARKTSLKEIYLWLLDFVKENYGIDDIDTNAKAELKNVAASLFNVISHERIQEST